jgi:hypothetical protein
MSYLQLPWQQLQVIEHTRHLLRSFQHWTGESLLPGVDDAALDRDALILTQQLFEAPFVVVSHGIEADPIFNYGNQQALELWELDWATFTQLPSRQSVEPTASLDREQLLAEAKANGMIRNYRGIRRSRSGRRFWINDVILWEVFDDQSIRRGQAAKFATWTFLPEPPSEQ